ncbi:ras-specific guanine nucleotide-releasing factor 1-like [Paramacrobiotus metropolitanus]|uniref:ras-specific guanine nucleotide-releasing factor 1-like n=1 Tax=Paramacrobiotus metropolitanus TaxID=2943436 RepID=UPI00244627A7|nr:ras-specific guanine nucleotide-releasing factor 1-like [Paramacrobiotus metropolitanus]
MQRSVRLHEQQLLFLAERARQEVAKSKSGLCFAGYMSKRSGDNKWQHRWFLLHQNLLFYFDNNQSSRPLGVILLEGSYCDRVILSSPRHKDKDADHQHCFVISYRKDNLKQYEFCTDSDASCSAWVDAITQASFNKVLQQKEELEQKHLHLLQIVESEKTSKWQLRQQCDDLSTEINKLRTELRALKRHERSSSAGSTSKFVTDFHPRYLADLNDEASDEQHEAAGTNRLGSQPELHDIKKIQKVQSFFRGWLCRRRWKQIVEEYIRSPHAENMRKRNSLVFSMVECEQEYVQQIQLLVTCFFRPLKMAASSKNPPISHEDVNSIFLNSETIFFLHQIFLKGLLARMENWPTLVLGDLFDMLLPMLSIYQEYVRNHHYSLQVLAECKQQPEFAALLRRLEEKMHVQGRSLEQFLTYPMNQIPRYIVTLHELLAHTPHDHVERKSLEYAKNRLEELSRIMHDEVSETENIRKNLGIERMIVEGCDILLDVNQVFVRQGTLVHVLKDASSRGRSSRFTRSASDKSEIVRQCFLFTNHLIITTRSATSGKLHLAKHVGKIALHDVTLIEDTCEMNDDEDQAANANGHPDKVAHADYQNRDFKIIIDQKPVPLTVHLVAATEEEKVAWTADILQCLENLRCSDLLNAALNEASSVTMPNSIKNDPKLFRDDIDIRFSRSLNSCKVPQIRYATLERLLERLTDLRFLSVDFLNTFLLTYRIFTNAMHVLQALIQVYQNAETLTIENISRGEVGRPYAGSVCYSIDHGDGDTLAADRRISTVSAPDHGEDPNDPRSKNPHWRWSFRKYEELQCGSVRVRKVRPDAIPSPIPASPCSSTEHQSSVEDQQDDREYDAPHTPKVLRPKEGRHLAVPGATFLTPTIVQVSPTPTSTPTPPPTTTQQNGVPTDKRSSIPSSDIRSPPSKPGEVERDRDSESEIFYLDTVNRHTKPIRTVPVPPPLSIASSSTLNTGTRTLPSSAAQRFANVSKFGPRRDIKRAYSPMELASVLTSPNLPRKRESNVSDYSGLSLSPRNSLRQPDLIPRPPQPTKRGSTTSDYSDYLSPRGSMMSPDQKLPIQPSKRGSNVSDVSGYASSYRSSVQFSEASRNSLFSSGDPTAPNSGKVGAVVTSSRRSGRRCSSAVAAAAFAVATAASANPPDMIEEDNEEAMRARRSSIICAAATMRVLNVLRHWVSKQRQDFESDSLLRNAAIKFLQDVVCDYNLIPAEQKLAGQILRTLTTGGDEPGYVQRQLELEKMLTPALQSSKDLSTIYSALEIAEQMTLLDHKIFMAMRGEEFLGMAWMKADKGEKAPNILLITKRFNETSRLVVSEIVGCSTVTERISVIEKWTAVADICRVLHNYNGVLQICAALVNSSVYRLKRTWQKLSKTTKLTIDKLQTLVASDGRFKNMREALHRCDPPCVPYLGMYLTDLSFIEEGTPNYAENGMINFSKMRMIAHVVQEIRLYQQTPYKIDYNPRVAAYLLDSSRIMSDDELYRRSLMIEPRTARMSVDIPSGSSAVAGTSGATTPQPTRNKEAKLQTQTSFPG